MQYFKWEEKKEIAQLKKMSGVKSLKAGFSLLRMALKMLKASLREENPALSGAKLHGKIREFLWQTE
jgi:uncharacterized protein (DUF2267 family)